jgi:hypothetical protein
MPLFSYCWQQSFISPFVPSDDDVVAAFLQVWMMLMLSSLPFLPFSQFVATLA